MPLETYIEELTNDAGPLVTSRLLNLSDLMPEELELLRRVWPHIPVARRRRIVGMLVDLADDNLDLDFDCVFRMCLDDEDAEVCARAIEGLWECEDHSLVKRFMSLLRQDERLLVRTAAAAGLGKFALLAELGKLSARDAGRIEEALLASINDPGEALEVRRRAVEAIASLDRPEVKEIIARAYQSDIPRMRVSAVYAMGQSCDPSWLPTLVKELESPDVEMRYEAARACGELEDERAVPYLVPLIDDEDSQVQVLVIEALGHIGGDAAKRRLRECLQSPDAHIREAVEDALAILEFNEDPLSFGMS